ncbi:putative DNA-invertase from lambdoid prophage Rac, partial [termite gut metagenome]
MIYGYIRVSTDRQTVENQRFEINQFCERNVRVVDKWIEET